MSNHVFRMDMAQLINEKSVLKIEENREHQKEVLILYIISDVLANATGTGTSKLVKKIFDFFLIRKPY
jgi:hypothetical protein